MRSSSSILFSFLALGSCSSSSGDSGGCNTHYDCPAGKTCWTTDGTTFSCVASGAGALGAQCDATLAGVKTVSCGDGEICLSTTSDPTHASCTAWCGGAIECPTGKGCRTVTTTLHATLVVCL